ncbi:MAG TPA: septum site-determining protein MinC [Clostridia bacterium]|nr:septum site-determining protein MinC [Clostridia bacterium]
MPHEAVSIKGTKNGLVIILDPNYSLEDLKAKLTDRFTSAKGFFQGAKFTLMAQKISKEETKELEKICCAFGLVPCDNIELPKAVGMHSRTFSQQKAAEKLDSVPMDAENCLLINHSLRSGQVVTYDGHVTILGDVNQGAEVIASGNILVLGTLRGVAHAGASGNTGAVIVAYRLQPDQLRISDVIARSPENNEPHDYPEKAFLSGNHIIITPYTTSNVHHLTKKTLF